MVEVLARGKPPNERVYETTCRYCSSQLRFVRSEAKLTADQRDGDYLTVTCPVCRSDVNVSSDG